MNGTPWKRARGLLVWFKGPHQRFSGWQYTDVPGPYRSTGKVLSDDTRIRAVYRLTPLHSASPLFSGAGSRRSFQHPSEGRMGESPARRGAPRPEHREAEGRPSSFRTERGSGAVISIPSNPNVCAALGCTETDDLLEVTTDEGTRVLCPDHIRGWLDR